MGVSQIEALSVPELDKMLAELHARAHVAVPNKPGLYLDFFGEKFQMPQRLWEAKLAKVSFCLSTIMGMIPIEASMMSPAFITAFLRRVGMDKKFIADLPLATYDQIRSGFAEKLRMLSLGSNLNQGQKNRLMNWSNNVCFAGNNLGMLFGQNPLPLFRVKKSMANVRECLNGFSTIREVFEISTLFSGYVTNIWNGNWPDSQI